MKHLECLRLFFYSISKSNYITTGHVINIVWHFNLHAVNFHTFGHLLPPIILKYILVYVCHVTFMGCLSQKYLHYIMLIVLYVIFLSILCPNVNIWYASITFVLLHKTVKTRLIHDVMYKTTQSFISLRDEWHTRWYNCWYHSNQYTRTINNSSSSFALNWSPKVNSIVSFHF